MKFSDAWLREWVDPPVDSATMAEQLTMAGLEVGAQEAATPPFDGVVLGRVRAVVQHPNADRLRVCTVDVGADETLEIVCGAPNVAEGMLVPVATVGARLPGGLAIRKTKLRGVPSMGMICSASELGLAEASDGILPLDGDGAPGTDVREYLALDDTITEVDLTPNRGDCLAIAGIAREVGALNRVAVSPPAIDPVAPVHDAVFPVDLEAPDGCPMYAGRIVRNIDPDATTPLWMQERLRRSGLRPISPTVDITNYVMLELGQPMHAFDLKTLDERIVVRRATEGERLTLLDGRTVDLAPDVLVIADGSGVKALAGIMGGESTGVEADTTDIFFESAFFAPLAIAGRARRFGLHTDASHRFERGVAPGAQALAVERATALLIEIAGGEPGPVHVAQAGDLPARPPVSLTRAALDRLLGVQVDDADVVSIFERLDLSVETTDDGWRVTPPPFRFDIEIAEDLIEEVARVHGFANIPETDALTAQSVPAHTETALSVESAADTLVDRGYQEVITYSFVDPSLAEILAPGTCGIALSNPISSEMSVMRTSMWPGLVDALRQNLSRQQNRVRIFEHGLKFIAQDNEIKQDKFIAGLAFGPRNDESWAGVGPATDFFDLKGEVEALLAATGRVDAFSFVAREHPVLHPGQSAAIVDEQGDVGWIGALHPAVTARLDIDGPVFVFELEAERILAARIPVFEPVSRFPSVRRDLAIVVREDVTAAAIQACASESAPEWLREIRVFDVYQGEGIDSGLKSVALGLILQDSSRTLTDGDADATVAAVRASLERDLEARIRD